MRRLSLEFDFSSKRESRRSTDRRSIMPELLSRHSAY